MSHAALKNRRFGPSVHLWLQVLFCVLILPVAAKSPASKSASSSAAAPPAAASPASPASASPSAPAPASPASAGAGIYAPKVINTKPIELIGEVVDAWCWSSGVMGEGRGEQHKACGTACVLGGVSCGIVDDQGRLFICAKSKAYKGCAEMMGRYVAKRVRVKGWLSERGGCRVLKLNSVEEVKALAH